MTRTAAFQYIDHIADDVDRLPAMSAHNTTVHAIDPAYPAGNLFTDDPSLVTRFNYTRNAVAGALYPRLQWSTTATDRACQVVAALNCRLPSEVVSVDAWLINHIGAAASTSPQVYARADLVPIDGTTDRYNLIFVFPAPVLAAAVDLRITLPINTSGYYEIGRLRCGPALTPIGGVDSGWSVLPIDPSQVARGPGGALAANPLPRRRRLSARVSVRDYAFAYGTATDASAPSLLGMRAYCGLSVPLLAVPRGESLHNLQRLSVFGVFTKEEPITEQADNHYFTHQVEVDEVR